MSARVGRAGEMLFRAEPRRGLPGNLLRRKLHGDGGSPLTAVLHPDRAAVEAHDLPYQREPQSRAAVLPAAGLVHPEEGLEDALLILLRDAAAGVGNADQELFRLLCDSRPAPSRRGGCT